MSKILSWGKCRVVYKNSEDDTWKEFPQPVEGSTTLATTKGEKTEAKVEGGENEAVRYAKNTYELNSAMRLAKDSKKPFVDKDGVVSGVYSVCVIPENIEAPGLYIEQANVSLEDTYNSADGATLTYAFDALTASKGDQLKWGTFTLTETTAGNIATATAFKFQEVESEGESKPAEINLLGA